MLVVCVCVCGCGCGCGCGSGSEVATLCGLPSELPSPATLVSCDRFIFICCFNSHFYSQARNSWTPIFHVTGHMSSPMFDWLLPTCYLRSAGCHQLFLPRHRRSMFGRRACSVAGPAACNSLPDLYLRDPSHSADSFRRDLKTFLVLPAYTAH